MDANLSSSWSTETQDEVRLPCKLMETQSRAQQLHTPPASPRSSGSISMASSVSFSTLPPPVVYLKALHAYSPTVTRSGTGDQAVCLELRPNSIIYIHSIHASGWADGSLLTGERGWFPSNYCEPYTLSVLLPLTQAKQSMANLVRLNKVTEYIAAVSTMVAAVRELLIDAQCLTRDCKLIKQNDQARRERKCLLSELSGLVTTAKRESLNLVEVGPQLSTRAERVAIRASRFIHIVGPASGIYAAEVARGFNAQAISTPPLSYDFSTSVVSGQELDCETYLAESFKTNTGSQSVLELLDHANDTLISVLTAFIARLHSQAQTQSPTPILQATSQCVNAARALLATFESICSHYPDRTVITSKDLLYRNITQLVTCARQVVDASDGVIFSTGKLIESATGVVRGAGQCTLRAKYILETKGDFSLPAAQDSTAHSLSRDDTSSSTLASLVDNRQSRDVQNQVETLDIPYKRVAPLAPRTVDTGHDEADEIAPLNSSSLRNIHLSQYSVPLSPAESEISDSAASTFREEDLEVNLNHESQIIGASMSSLIEYITPHDRTPDVLLTNTFFLTFRLFTTPARFSELLISRFTWTMDPSRSGDASWQTQVAVPVRLRVYNIMKTWLESHWRSEQDASALPLIQQFARETLADLLPQAGKRLMELATKILQDAADHKPTSTVGRNMSFVACNLAFDVPAPPSIVTRQQLSILRNPSGDCAACIVDFDEMEIARQFTLMESRIFCAITPVELVGQEFSKKGGSSLAVNVKAMSAASTDLAGWVADTILSETEQKKRTNVLKHWIKIAERCAQLQNFNTLMAIMCALNSSTIARLKRTWDGLSRSQRTSIEHLRSVTDHQRNYAIYRAKIREANAPCLPFLGLYLTDLTFIDEGNPNHRHSKSSDRRLINFDKHIKTSKVVADLQRLQVPYKLQEVPELIEWLSTSTLRMRTSSADLSTTLWRRSLVIEPKFPMVMKREPSATSSVESDPKPESKSHKMSFLAAWSS